MFNPFQQFGAIKEAMRIKNELEAQVVEVEKNGVKIVITGGQKIKSLESNGRSNDDIKEAVNEAIKKSQEAAAKKLQSMSGSIQSLLGGK